MLMKESEKQNLDNEKSPMKISKRQNLNDKKRINEENYNYYKNNELKNELKNDLFPAAGHHFSNADLL